MIKKLAFALMLSLGMAGSAAAQSLPDYYPDSFQETGYVDAVYLDESRVVVGDIVYTLSDSVVVYSLSSDNDSLLRVREGAHVGMKLSGGRHITAIWLLPDVYKPRGRR